LFRSIIEKIKYSTNRIDQTDRQHVSNPTVDPKEPMWKTLTLYKSIQGDIFDYLLKKEQKTRVNKMW